MALLLQNWFENDFWRWAFSIILNVIFLLILMIVIFAIWNLYTLRNSIEISNRRFISLTIVLAEIIICISHYLFNFGPDTSNVFDMVENLIKYCGFYYSIYFFASNAVEILSNKENEFIYYTKLGLVSTIFIQVLLCLTALVLSEISYNQNGRSNFWANNVWVIMRFLALAVTIGFIFIGWQIQQSILNPLLSQQKRKNIIDSRKKKESIKKSIKIKLSKSVDDEPMYTDK